MLPVLQVDIMINTVSRAVVDVYVLGEKENMVSTIRLNLFSGQRVRLCLSVWPIIEMLVDWMVVSLLTWKR